jgi:dTDP-4-dehydrorhamnose reductase
LIKPRLDGCSFRKSGVERPATNSSFMRRTKLLILGATGILGHQLLDVGRRDPRFEAWGTVRNHSAIRWLPREFQDRVLEWEQFAVAPESLLHGRGFEVIINCVGITRPGVSESIAAIKINSLAPHLIAKAASVEGCRMIHVSTDCVFSGRCGNYREEDQPDPVDLYGLSKWLGEINSREHLTVRTSFIGWDLHAQNGLLAWFLSQRQAVHGYARAYWSGFTSQALSRILLELALRPDVTGLLHVAGEAIDKCTLLRKIQKAMGTPSVLIQPKLKPVCDRTLDNSHFSRLGIPWPSLDEMLCELASGSTSRAC